MTGLDSLRRSARRVPKAAFWLMTPWRMPERLRFMRQRSANEARARELDSLIERERARQEAWRAGDDPLPTPPLDLRSDAGAADAADLPLEEVFGPAPAPSDVVDTWAAARFCIALLRSRKDLYLKFPRALSEPVAESHFLAWLQSDQGLRCSGLAPESIPHFKALFAGDPSARARQVFLSDDRIREVLPHGLTPAGQHALFRWFMRHALPDAAVGLRREEIVWLFMQAAENPRDELVRAYLFTPDWQRQFPDAITMFGWAGFAKWFVRHYGANPLWVDVERAPDWHGPAEQLRIAHVANATWRAIHPEALSDALKARAWLEWLTYGADLPATVRQWCQALDLQAVVPTLVAPGANIIGHFCYPSGLRVSVESIVHSLAQVGVETSLRDVRTDARDDPCHVRFAGQEMHDVTLIHAQPEPYFLDAYARADLAERVPRTYRIAYWYWEFDSIPDAWVECATRVDEVWTATEFIARGLRERLSVPVRTLFPGVRLAPFKSRNRAELGLEEDRYTFLFTFHMMSVMERKNPLGLIRAFRAAFPEDEKVSLVLKTSFGERYPAELQQLRDAASGANITIIDKVFSPDEVLSLMNACDAYVSLHRSEGLGLTMAEAMLMGKPVIATNFSGNVDFMDDSNSLLVPYELVKLGEPIPPYEADLEWAEPSEERAAQLMRRLYEDQEWGRAIGARAKSSAETNLSLKAAGQRIRARLEEIEALRRARQ
ncbi:glycosyltransferase family 4 protein [Variovorax sp. J22P271]|uniref:glycosyltransferase family 4 protein n=1 Tax=Variovorax davisae TaxID=3053515 RepID=UPI0025786B64|nr:glycosyltransferase family 4 protein [Variovorax sp. J22P271]MDM0033320.1 glycosyltransferase family 4 protein [Variovorax sp. J22P271]